MLRYASSRSFNLTTRFSCGLRRAGHVKIKKCFLLLTVCASDAYLSGKLSWKVVRKRIQNSPFG